MVLDLKVSWEGMAWAMGQGGPKRDAGDGRDLLRRPRPKALVEGVRVSPAVVRPRPAHTYPSPQTCPRHSRESRPP